MVLNNGYAVGVYVGFDNNKAMKRTNTHITGYSGALPTWTEMVNSLLRERLYSQKLDPVDISFYGLTILHGELGQINLAVNKEEGGILLKPAVEVDEKDRSQASILTFGQLYETGRFKLYRKYQPFWGELDGFTEEDIN